MACSSLTTLTTCRHITTTPRKLQDTAKTSPAPTDPFDFSDVSFPTSPKSSKASASANDSVAATLSALNDAPADLTEGESNWSRSFQGFGAESFAPEITEILMQDLDPNSVEIKPGMFLRCGHQAFFHRAISTF